MAATAPLNTFPPPPPGLNYIEALKPSLNMLMIGTVWSAALVPLLIILFFFSTKELRKKPIFILNVASILMGISLGILNGVFEFRAMLYPLRTPDIKPFVAFGFLIALIPIFVETILVFRLIAVFPPGRTPPLLFYSIFIPLAFIKVARIINVSVFMAQAAQSSKSFDSPIAFGQSTWRTHPGQRIEWFLQVIDNTIASALFLWRLRSGRRLADKTAIQSWRRASYTRRLKGLFWIAVSNFVFPVLLSLTQLIFIYHDLDYLKGTYIFFNNAYVEIVGVLLATVWSAGSHWTDEKNPHVTSSLPTMRFGSSSGRTANESVVISSQTMNTDGTRALEGDITLEYPKMTFTEPKVDEQGVKPL